MRNKILIFILSLFIGLVSFGQINNNKKIIASYAQANVVVSYDTDAQAFIDAVGTLTTTEEVAINNLVLGLKSNGTWSKYHAIYPIIGGTAASHKWNLKNPLDTDAAFRLVFSGTVTHTSNGMQGNGTTGFADTFYNPTSHGTTNNVSLSYYSRSDNNASYRELSYISSTTVRLSLSVDFSSGGAAFFAYGTGGGSTSGVNTSSAGYFVGTRTSSSDSRIFHNGTQSGSTQTSSAGTPPNGVLYLMASNTGSAATQFSTRQCAFASIGLGLTPTEVANDYTVIQAYQTALGRQLNLWWVIVLIPSLLKGRVIKLNTNDNIKHAA